MNLKKVFFLATLITGINLCMDLSMVYAVEYKEEWMNSWGGSGTETAKSVVSTSDGGFVTVGYGGSTDAGVTNHGFYDGIIAKYDSDGNQEWVKSWGGTDDDYFESVIQTSDGGFVVVGNSWSTDAGFTNQGYLDGIIIKYDPDGNQEWMKSWGGDSSEYLNSVIETSDKGLIVVGYSGSANAGFTSHGFYDAIIMKFDSDGNQQWVKSWGGSGGDFFYSATSTSDNGVLVVGESNSANAGFTYQGYNDAIIIKYDQDGNQQWVKSWGGSKNDNFNSVIQTFDDGFVVTGDSNSTDAGFTNQGGYDGIIIKYDQNGNQQWMRSWGGGNSDYFNSVIETPDKRLIAVGNSNSTDAAFTNQGGSDAIIVNYDPDGNQQWMKSWGGNGSDSFNSVIKTLDGGFLTIGSSRSTDIDFTNQGGSDAIIIKYSPKTDADIQIKGTIQPLIANVTFPSVSPDLVINPNLSEGVVSSEFSIENQSTSPIRLELKTFEQTTHSFNDVLPEKYDSWEGLNKTQSEDIALGLVAKDGAGWQRLTTPTSYVAGHSEHEIGVIKPTSTVSFEFDVHHGRAFSESKTVQYRMVFVFDLLN